MQPREEEPGGLCLTWVVLAAPSCGASCPAAIEEHHVPFVGLLTAQGVWGQVAYFQSRELLQEIREGHPEERRDRKEVWVRWTGPEERFKAQERALLFQAAVDCPDPVLQSRDPNKQGYHLNLSLWSISLFLKNLPPVSASHTELGPGTKGQPPPGGDTSAALASKLYCFKLTAGNQAAGQAVLRAIAWT